MSGTPARPRGGARRSGGHSGGHSGGRGLGLVLLTGAVAGFLSGLFGVGGGLVIVPALVAVLGLDQRRAAATSLAVIVSTAAVGAASYGWQGRVSLPAAAFVVAGALGGARAGTWLLRRLPAAVLPWVFVAFVVLVVVSQQLREPVREVGLTLDAPRAVALVAVGVLSGIMAGLVGVGGGAVIVPGLELVVGVGDLTSRGTSMLVMVPTALYGTWRNLRHGLVEARVAAVVGACACLVAPLGALTAAAITPRTGSALFSVFLVGVVASTLLKERRRRRAEREGGSRA